MSNLSDKELTELLISKDAGTTHGSPKFFKSDVTGNLYDYERYRNHGHGAFQRFIDLPKDEYPYSIIYNNPNR